MVSDVIVLNFTIEFLTAYIQSLCGSWFIISMARDNIMLLKWRNSPSVNAAV
jgi:hypothetical protein